MVILRESVKDFLVRNGFKVRGTYGDYLYRNRKRLKLTRKQVSKKATLPVSRITLLESGKEEPTFKDLILLRYAKYDIVDSILMKFNAEYNPAINYLDTYLKVKRKKV